MRLALLAATAIVGLAAQASALTYVNSITIPGNATDLYGGSGANANRLGGFGSDLVYDRTSNSYFGLVDRGPGGGVISYNTRVQQFTLDVNPNTGAIGNFTVTATTGFTDTGGAFNGLNPNLLNGTVAVQGRSLDPEGFVIGRNGNYFVSDEYGPSVKEFKSDGTLVRSFTTPTNLLPTTNGQPNFGGGSANVTAGRQDNRGFEGLTLSTDGKKLYAILQDPLQQEGSGGSNPGRNSRNLRIVEFDVASGTATKQVIYQLEALADINARIPGTTNDFAANSQGRNIGVSAIQMLADGKMLVLERDNRGIGVDDPTGATPIGSKRVFKIDLTDATDVSNISLAGTNTLPNNVQPVKKELFLDIQAELAAKGLPIPEKFEGLTIGPQLANGLYLLLLGTDNDFSVTQNSSNVQFDVCASAIASTQVALDAACPAGMSLLPSYLYAFTATAGELNIPEPASLVLLGAGLLGLGAARRRRG